MHSTKLEPQRGQEKSSVLLEGASLADGAGAAAAAGGGAADACEHSWHQSCSFRPAPAAGAAAAGAAAGCSAADDMRGVSASAIDVEGKKAEPIISFFRR
jgi:hypothetical protein